MENIEPHSHYVRIENSPSLIMLGQDILNLVSITTLIVISIILIICMWKLFKKNGKKGWKSLIPIYNVLVLLKMGNLSPWFVLLPFSMFILFVGLLTYSTFIPSVGSLLYLMFSVIIGNKLHATLNSYVLTAVLLFPLIALIIYFITCYTFTM